MSKRRIIETTPQFQDKINVSEWPKVLIENLSLIDQEKFNQRKLAIEMYIEGKTPINKITEKTQINRVNLNRLLKRCLEHDDQGIIWGYRALIPRKRITSYQRTKTVPSQIHETSLPGAFSQLLRNYPIIKEKIDEIYLKRNKNVIHEPRYSTKVIHRQFIKLCREQGLTINDYPLNTNTLAYRSLCRYLKNLQDEYLSEAANQYGEDAKRLLNTTGTGSQNHPMIVRPLNRVQFDGHRIDAKIAIIFHTPEGDEIVRVMERIWILTIIDVATRAILGYYISLNKEYSAEDVLQCIKNAIVPWKPRTLTIPSLNYPACGGFPSGVIPETQWGLWDEIWFDRGKANLANIVKDRLEKIVGCSVNIGPVKTPERRAIIERFFGILEENGYHRLINTTGSSPFDPRRQNAEEKAEKYRISTDHIEEITEILLANYNGTSHEGVNNLTPLEVMAQRIERQKPLPIIRQMPEEDKVEVMFFSLQAYRQVVGNVKKGKRPHINYEGVLYRNEVLARTPELIGTTLTLVVNIEDIRTVTAFLPDGSELGTLTAHGKWGIRPHSLKTRKEINKLRNRKILQFATMDDPIEVYHQYLLTSAKTNKNERNRLAQMQREEKRAAEQSHNFGFHEENKSSTQYKENKDNETEIWKNVSDTKPYNRKFKRTIVF
ncbi:hypothetical protein [Ammoniphilus resinae]|uniref:Transposase InsO family protein n=1 Tax=Ammoniphilus resinae TaxID=861532 RepID=A0ABS4GP17_9BACL|nr:hypothetical protein [Ammoniphilus resinae]MBP1931986.1 transposase InsO family protein [Ammoniphilus resinae]